MMAKIREPRSDDSNEYHEGITDKKESNYINKVKHNKFLGI